MKTQITNQVIIDKEDVFKIKFQHIHRQQYIFQSLSGNIVKWQIEEN